MDQDAAPPDHFPMANEAVPEALEPDNVGPFFSDSWLYTDTLRFEPFTSVIGNSRETRETLRTQHDPNYEPRRRDDDDDDLDMFGEDSDDDDHDEGETAEAMEIDEELSQADHLRGVDYCFLCATHGDPRLANQRAMLEEILALANGVSREEVCARVKIIYDESLMAYTGKIWTIPSILDHMMRHKLDEVRIQGHVVRRFLDLEDYYASTVVRKGEGDEVLPPDHHHTRMYVSVLQGLERATGKFYQYRTSKRG